MQWNQPLPDLAFKCSPQNHAILRNPQVIGEGEISSIFLPDGSMQLYFVPTMRHDWTPFQCNTVTANTNTFINPINAEYWFVRGATCPSTAAFNTPNVFGDRLRTQLFNPNYCVNVPNYPDYYQKFHSDNTTSTTDILYFYPNLRHNSKPQNSAIVQTCSPIANWNDLNGGVCERHCNCKVSFRVQENEPDDCACQESTSSMSVDGVNNFSKHSIKNKKKTRHNNNRKHRDHYCGCRNVKLKGKSDKTVTTYSDQASGNVPTDGRETQTTQKSKRSDVKTEIWLPINGKHGKKSNSSINTVAEDGSCCHSDCACDSTTETEG